MQPRTFPIPKPLKNTLEKRIGGFCCFCKSPYKVIFHFDKAEYCPGDEIKAKVHLDNS